MVILQAKIALIKESGVTDYDNIYLLQKV
jgi:hypothetical protein